MKDYHTTPVALAADHGGYALKEAIRAHLEAKGIPYKDFGTHSADSCDYPDMALPACQAVTAGQCSCAILCCGTGVGMSMCANKVRGIRACCCSEGLALSIVDIFLSTPFEGGRHSRRIEKVMAIEQL